MSYGPRGLGGDQRETFGHRSRFGDNRGCKFRGFLFQWSRHQVINQEVQLGMIEVSLSPPRALRPRGVETSRRPRPLDGSCSLFTGQWGGYATPFFRPLLGAKEHWYNLN